MAVKAKSKKRKKVNVAADIRSIQALSIKLGITQPSDYNPDGTPAKVSETADWQERYNARVQAEREAIRTAFESFLQTRILPSLPLIGDSKDLARVAYAIELFANQFLEYPTEFKDGLGKFSGIADEDLDEALGITRMEANIPLVLPNEGREPQL